jgi:hypothetical protein
MSETARCSSLSRRSAAFRVRGLPMEWSKRVAGVVEWKEPQEAEGEGAVVPIDGRVSCGTYSD